MKESQEIGWAQVRIGLFFVVSLALLGVGIFMIGERARWFIPVVKIDVQMEDVQGLKAGAPVWLAGVVVGTVEGIAFSEPLRSDRVTVTLEMERDAARRIGGDARVAVRTRGLLGEKYVEVLPGTVPGIPEKPLQGEPPMSLDQTLARAYEAFEKFSALVDRIGNPESTLGRLFADASLYDGLLELTERLRDLVAAATEGEGSLARLLEDPVLYRRLSAFAEQGEKAAGNFRELVEKVHTEGGTLGRLVQDPALYEESLAAVRRLQGTLEEVEGLAADLRRGEGTAGRLIREDDLHQRLERTLAELERLLEDVRENPGRYVRFSLF